MESYRRSSCTASSAESSEEEMNIYLKIMKTVALKVKRSETINSVKAIVHEKEGFSENLQEIYFAGDRLEDGQTLLDYGIQKGSTLHLVIQNSVGMKIFVAIPSERRTIVVEAKNHDTIQIIKSVIQAKEGIPSDQYTLMHAGKIAEDDRTLASLNVQEKSTFHLVFNPRDILSIFVKTPNREIIKLEAKLLFLVRDLKAIVASMIGFQITDQCLVYAGIQLDDCKTLAYYCIKDGSVLEISPPQFQIFVKTSEKTITLDVHQLNSVRDVKKKIFHKVGTPIYAQGLIFAGKWLDGDRDLASYNIQKMSTLSMFTTHSKEFTSLQLNVKALEDTDHTSWKLDLWNYTTIRDLKAMIQKKTGRTPKNVYYSGNAMNEHASLAYYGIWEDATVHVDCGQC